MTDLYVVGEDKEAFPESGYSVGESRQVFEVALQFNMTYCHHMPCHMSSMPAVNSILNIACSRTKLDSRLFCKPYCIDPVNAVCIHTCSDLVRLVLLKATFLMDFS